MITFEPPRNSTALPSIWVASGLSRAGLSRFANRAQAAVGLTGEVDVLLASDATLRRLNREFRGKNKATDVLSFPAPKDFADGHSGDLAISLQIAQQQAKEHGHSLRDEVRVLLLHGMLHLAGFDHEIDSGEMAAREAMLRAELRLPVGLIERAILERKLPSETARRKGRAKVGVTASHAEKSPKGRRGKPRLASRRQVVA